MSRRWETHCRSLVDNEILGKSRLHENEIYKRGFDTSNSSKIIKTSSSSSVSSLYSILLVTTRIFCLKLRKKKKNNNNKNQGKERETGCFQSRITNNVSAKTSTKTKCQTSRGQNLYSSSLSFSGLKLSNLNKKDAETQWHTGVRSVCTIFFLNLGRFSSRLHYDALDLYATFKIRSMMIYFVPFWCPAISKVLGLTHVIMSKWVKSH